MKALSCVIGIYFLLSGLALASLQYEPASLNISIINYSLFSQIFLFWIFGLALGLTTSAVPLLLIMTSICNDNNVKHPLLVTFIYTLSAAITFSILGCLFALLGHYSYSLFHSAWTLVFLSSLFMIMGLSSLGLFSFKPSANLLKVLAAKPHLNSNWLAYYKAISNGVSGIMIALPCIASPLIGVLAYIALIGDMQFGIITMFMTGVGFCTPLIAVCSVDRDIILKAGHWQSVITQLFGMMLFGIAIWMLTPILPNNMNMYLWAALAMFISIYFGALSSEKKRLGKIEEEHEVCNLDGTTAPQKSVQIKNANAAIKMITFIILIYGVILLIAAMMGYSNPVTPFTRTSSNQVNTNSYSR